MPSHPTPAPSGWKIPPKSPPAPGTGRSPHPGFPENGFSTPDSSSPGRGSGSIPANMPLSGNRSHETGEACPPGRFSLSARTSEADNRDNNCRPGGCHNTGCTVYNRRIPPTPPSALPPVRPPSSDAPARRSHPQTPAPDHPVTVPCSLNVLPCRR